MKIEVELPSFPEWDNERCIYILAGIELVAYKYPGRNWMVKIVRCNMCGECCMDLGNNQPFPLVTTDGVCDHLEKEPGDNKRWRCALSLNRPFGCCIAEPSGKDYCCIEWGEA